MLMCATRGSTVSTAPKEREIVRGRAALTWVFRAYKSWRFR
jgi:hypothetical protein